MAEFGRDLWKSSGLNPYLNTATLNVSKHRGFSTSLGNFCQCLAILLEVFPDVQEKDPFVPIAAHPVTVLFAPAFQLFTSINKMPLNLLSSS